MQASSLRKVEALATLCFAAGRAYEIWGQAAFSGLPLKSFFRFSSHFFHSICAPDFPLLLSPDTSQAQYHASCIQAESLYESSISYKVQHVVLYESSISYKVLLPHAAATCSPSYVHLLMEPVDDEAAKKKKWIIQRRKKALEREREREAERKAKIWNREDGDLEDGTLIDGRHIIHCQNFLGFSFQASSIHIKCTESWKATEKSDGVLRGRAANEQMVQVEATFVMADCTRTGQSWPK